MEESRIINTRRVTVSGLVTEKPCLVYSICGIGLAQASNVYGVHDGYSTSGEIEFRLVAGSYSADYRLFASPWYFAHGLYVDFTTNGEEVAIQFLEVAR